MDRHSIEVIPQDVWYGQASTNLFSFSPYTMSSDSGITTFFKPSSSARDVL